MVAISRQPIKTFYPDGRVDTFNPWFRYFFQTGGIGILEIGIPGHYAIGVMWTHHIGTWSRIKTKWVTIWGLEFYLHLGECEPYNPQTGEIYS